MQSDIKVVSLNIQHAWNSPLPLLFRKADVYTNLDKIAAFLTQYEPDIVLLQEVDKISPITREIDQLAYLAEKVGYLHHAHGSASEWHVGNRVVYAAGCGILSRFPIIASESVRFEPSLPTPRKGFVSATLAVSEERTVTAVSVHLPVFDVLNFQSRRMHIERIVSMLKDRGPIIIGGDFNMSFSMLNRVNIHTLSKRLNVKTHKSVFNPALATYPAHDPRRKIDWIFSSPELEMTDYTVFPERVSDHLAIGTTIAWQ